MGSGKSSLVAALLGQMKQTSGERNLYGSVCYVPQEAWLLNMSFRDNITFGSDFDPKHYRKTIEVCALERDIKLMADGDLTEIGERGINLSGGQRQRISLARAVYKYSDTILLDDPLSAVDQHVGKHIFDKCITGYLRNKGKSVIFVTHQLQYLSQVDDIIVIKNNQIFEKGSFDELMKRKGHLYSLIGENVETIDEDPLQEIYEEADEGGEIERHTDETSAVPSSTHIRRSRGSFRTANEVQLNVHTLPVITEGVLTQDQVLNRKRLSIRTHASMTDESIAKIIESHQSTLMSTDVYSRKSFVDKIERDRVSIVSAMLADPETIVEEVKEADGEQGIVMPEDSAPMKLVLDDQSLTYKKSPIMTYLQAGSGTVITITIFVYFFLVHLIRILSGEEKHFNHFHLHLK